MKSLIILLVLTSFTLAEKIPHGVRIHFNLSDKQYKFIDEHFDFVMTPDLGNDVRATFQHAKLLLYRSIQGTWKNFTQFDWFHIDSCENMFCHTDSIVQDTSTRIKTEWDSYLMEGRDLVDKTAPDAMNHWINYYAVTASTQVHQYNYDGLFIDSASHLLKESWLDKGLPWNYTPESWRDGRYKALAFIKSYLPDKTVIFNGLHSGFGADSSLTLTDGGMWEDFAFDPDSGDYKGMKAWYDGISCMEKNKEKASLVFVIKKKGLSEDYTARIFSVASYLLISSSNIYLTLSDYTHHEVPQYYPEFEIDLGEPAGSFQIQQDTLFWRKFEHGLVVVNPSSTNSKTFNLDKEYYKIVTHGGGYLNTNADYDGSLSYEAIEGEVTIPPVAALILRDSPAGVDEREGELPNDFSLEQNYPNPFGTKTGTAPVTKINFRTSCNADVSLSVYDVNGRLVKTLMSGRLNAGTYSAVWDGTNFNNNEVASGVYFCVLKTRGKLFSKKMVFLK